MMSLAAEVVAPSPVRDIVVMGASAGGLPGLLTVIGGLPADFPGVVIVALHLPAGARSALASVLSRAGALPASPVEEGQPLQPGHIYVAPPNLNHVIVSHGTLHLVFGPRENFVRPAIDPLFRSAARAYGPRVVGVVLSGTGADGTKGLQAIKTHGGVAIAQDPAEAEFSGMPSYAIRYNGIDHVLPAARIAPLLDSLARSFLMTGDDPPSEDLQEQSSLQPEEEAREHNLASPLFPMQEGAAMGFTCPDCGGPLWERRDGEERWFGCRVGHRYSSLGSLVVQQAQTLEWQVWGIVNTLEERALLLRQLTPADDTSPPLPEAEATMRAEQAERLARTLRDVLPSIL